MGGERIQYTVGYTGKGERNTIIISMTAACLGGALVNAMQNGASKKTLSDLKHSKEGFSRAVRPTPTPIHYISLRISSTRLTGKESLREFKKGNKL